MTSRVLYLGTQLGTHSDNVTILRIPYARPRGPNPNTTERLRGERAA